MSVLCTDDCGQMCRYVGVVVYQGLIEDVSTFKSLAEAAAWVTILRQIYGWEDTQDSLTWDTEHQISVDPQSVKEPTTTV